MGFKFKFEMNDAMRERMNAGLAFIYTTRDGHRWYIDATLNIPFRQIDLSECMYDALSLDGLGFFPSYPSLSMCQFALEEGFPEWHGKGWYWMAKADEEEESPEWFDDIEAFKPRVVEVRSHGGGYMANFAGDGPEPIVIY